MDLKFWNEVWGLFMSAPVTIIALMIVCFFIGFSVKAALDSSEKRGLRASSEAAEQRLQLAKEKETEIAPSIEQIRRNQSDQQQELIELRAALATMQQSQPLTSTVEAMGVTASSTASAVNRLVTANNELWTILTAPSSKIG